MHRLLIVEDERPLRDGLMAFEWKRLGFQAVGAEPNGEAALDFLGRQEVDVVLTDIRMPFIDGLELTRRARLGHPGLKVLLLSGHRDFEYAKAAIRLGVTEYLLKPVNLDELRQVFLDLKADLDEKAGRGAVLHEPAADPEISPAGSVPTLGSSYIHKAQAYIQTHLGEKFSMSQVAEQVGLNESYFSQLFKRETGENFVDWVRDRRVAQAVELMRTTDLKVFQIGRTVGYDDPAYFAATFRRSTGHTPIDYKRRFILEG